MICNYCNNFKTDAVPCYVDSMHKIVCSKDREKLLEQGLEVVVI